MKLIKKNNEKETKENFNLEASLLSFVPEPAFTIDLHKCQTDNSATYNIHAHAEQQPPSEDMAKLSELFSQMTESVPKKGLPE